MCPGEVKTTINFFLVKNGPFSPNFKKGLGACRRRDTFVVCAETEIPTFSACAETLGSGAETEGLGA